MASSARKPRLDVMNAVSFAVKDRPSFSAARPEILVWRLLMALSEFMRKPEDWPNERC